MMCISKQIHHLNEAKRAKFWEFSAFFGEEDEHTFSMLYLYTIGDYKLHAHASSEISFIMNTFSYPR